MRGVSLAPSVRALSPLDEQPETNTARADNEEDGEEEGGHAPHHPHVGLYPQKSQLHGWVIAPGHRSVVPNVTR